ncbi:hypothetical protein M408DRAFT_62011, partial [Serendipita vermifera MAFF 305830]
STTSSPKKSSSPKKAKLPVKPESEWRKSDVPIDTKIAKGFAQKLFRLTSKDINDSDLTFEKRDRVGDTQGYMLLYSMREIERLAWKKHGGPEGFKQRLDRDKEQWIAKGRHAIAFPMVPQPFTYVTDNKCVLCDRVFAMPSSVWYDKCDPCRGIVRPYRSPNVGQFDGIGVMIDLFTYEESCPTCEFLCTCRDD